MSGKFSGRGSHKNHAFFPHSFHSDIEPNDGSPDSKKLSIIFTFHPLFFPWKQTDPTRKTFICQRHMQRASTPGKFVRDRDMGILGKHDLRDLGMMKNNPSKHTLTPEKFEERNLSPS